MEDKQERRNSTDEDYESDFRNQRIVSILLSAPNISLQVMPSVKIDKIFVDWSKMPGTHPPPFSLPTLWIYCDFG